MGRRTRRIVAALLALAIAGLGHAYLRLWRRAAGWFVTIVGTGILLVSTFASPDTPVQELPAEVLLPVFALFLLSAWDASRLAARGPTSNREDDTLVCPNCGGELDEGLDFCPWCAEPLGDPQVDGDGRSVEH